MRHLGSVLVEASLDGDVPDVTGIEGVTSVVIEDQVLRCQVGGSVEPLLQALAKAGTRRLLSREPSLEELFLAHYGNGTVGPPKLGRCWLNSSRGDGSSHERRSLVVLGVSGRSAVRSGLLWGLVFGGFVASSAWSYVGFYKSEHQRDQLEAAYGFNHALSALFGPFPLQTVTGFILYKTFVVLLILRGIWGVLTATRLLRR